MTGTNGLFVVIAGPTVSDIHVHADGSIWTRVCGWRETEHPTACPRSSLGEGPTVPLSYRYCWLPYGHDGDHDFR